MATKTGHPLSGRDGIDSRSRARRVRRHRRRASGNLSSDRVSIGRAAVRGSMPAPATRRAQRRSVPASPIIPPGAIVSAPLLCVDAHLFAARPRRRSACVRPVRGLSRAPPEINTPGGWAEPASVSPAGGAFFPRARSPPTPETRAASRPMEWRARATRHAIARRVFDGASDPFGGGPGAWQRRRGSGPASPPAIISFREADFSRSKSVKCASPLLPATPRRALSLRVPCARSRV